MAKGKTGVIPKQEVLRARKGVGDVPQQYIDKHKELWKKYIAAHPNPAARPRIVDYDRPPFIEKIPQEWYIIFEKLNDKVPRKEIVKQHGYASVGVLNQKTSHLSKKEDVIKVMKKLKAKKTISLRKTEAEESDDYAFHIFNADDFAKQRGRLQRLIETEVIDKDVAKALSENMQRAEELRGLRGKTTVKNATQNNIYLEKSDDELMKKVQQLTGEIQGMMDNPTKKSGKSNKKQPELIEVKPTEIEDVEEINEDEFI